MLLIIHFFLSFHQKILLNLLHIIKMIILNFTLLTNFIDLKKFQFNFNNFIK